LNSLFRKLKTLKEKNEQKLYNIIKQIEKKGSLDNNDSKMIRNIIDLKYLTVKELMVPRVDVTGINKDATIEDILQSLSIKIYSRLPVYNEKIDNIIGILHTKDLLKSIKNCASLELEKIIRPAFFIPETKIINALLIELREKKSHMAIVVDEYGGMSGIITLEDIVEKIIGDIQDEFDNEIDDIIELSDHSYLINPRITIEELNEQLGINLKVDQIDTLGGLMFMLFGRIPLKGEKVTYHNMVFTIESIIGRNIKAIKMRFLANE